MKEIWLKSFGAKPVVSWHCDKLHCTVVLEEYLVLNGRGKYYICNWNEWMYESNKTCACTEEICAGSLWSQHSVDQTWERRSGEQGRFLLEVKYLLLTLLKFRKLFLLFPGPTLQAALLEMTQTGHGRRLDQFSRARRSSYRLRTERTTSIQNTRFHLGKVTAFNLMWIHLKAASILGNVKCGIN